MASSELRSPTHASSARVINIAATSRTRRMAAPSTTPTPKWTNLSLP
ncbi:hypothetical protein AALF15_12435 [Corynebacteriaceae bacterium 7-707]|nr:hypothetical protein [Corynebacterium sp.]